MTKEDVLKAIERGRRLAQQSQSQTGQGVTSSNNSIDKLRESVIRRPLTQAAQQQANRDAERFVQQQNALMGGNMSYNQYQNALNSTRQALNNQYQKEYNNQYDYLTNYTQYDYTGKSREEAEARLNELNRELHTAGSDGHQRAVAQEMTDAQNYIDSLMSVDEVNAKINELENEKKRLAQESVRGLTQRNGIDNSLRINQIDGELDRYKTTVLSNAYTQEDKNLLGALSDEEKQNLSDYYNSFRYITSEEGNLPGKAAQQEWIRQNEIYNNAKKSLEGKYTQEQINRLAEALEYTQNAEIRQTMQEDFASMAQNAREVSDKTPLSSSAPQILPILGQTVLEGASAIASPIENAATLIHSLFNERPIDYNDPIYALTNMSNDLSTALVEANADRKLYPIVNGMARVIGSLGGSAIAGGGNAKLVKFFMGNNAASNAALEMAERGGSNADIVGTAIAAAVAEMIFEGTFDRAVGLGDETARILSSSKPVLEGVKSFFKSIGAEVSEEVATDIANTLYDTIINGDMSDYSMAVNEYIRQGMTEKEAKKQWAKDFGMQLKDTVIISALMGGLLSGGGYIGNVRQARVNNQALQVLQEVQSLPPQEANALMTGFVNSGQSRAEADAILKQASEVIAQQQAQNAQPLDFMQSVDKARLDTNSESIKNLNTLFKNRGIEASVQDIFNDSNIAGIWTAEEKDGKTVRRVVFNPNATTQQWIQNTAIHELWHDMSASKTSSEIAELIKGYNLTKSEYETAYKALEQEYAKIYDPNSADFNALVEEEAVASVLGSRLGTQEFVNELVNSKPTVAKKIYDWVVDKLNKLNKLTGYKSEKLFWKDIENKFKTAYGEEYQGEKNTTKALIDPNFVSRYNAWDKKDKNGYFILGTTSEALESIGIDPKKIRWYKGKILEIQNKHKGMIDSVIKQVPDVLENPILVMQSQTVANRVVIIGELRAEEFDEKGKSKGMHPVICALELRPNGKITNFNVVTSSYPQAIQGLIDDSDILYIDPNKKRTNNWLQFLRLQLPANVTQYGSIGTVTYYEPDVKNDTKNSAMSDALNAYLNKNGKMSANSDQWQDYVNKNFAPEGTGQSIKDLKAVDNTASFNAKNSVKSQVMPDLDLESFKGSIESRYLSGEKLTAESVTSARERATNAVRKKSLKETRDYLATYLTDEAYVVDKATRNKQDRIVYEVYTDAKSGTAKALINMGMQSGNKFIGALTDASGKIVNKSVSELLNPFKNADFNRLGLENPTKSELKEAQKQYWQDAQDYLYLLHNLDCINNGKPRLIDLSEAETQNRIATLESAHPEFKSDLIKARNIITDFILQYEIDTGRITQEEADAWQKLYPNYVPTFREIEGEVSQSLLKAGADYNARARAKGSALKLLPLDESIFRKLDHATVYGQRNLFFNQMLKAGLENEQLADNYKILKVIDDVKGMSTREVLGETAKQKNTYIAYTSNGGVIVFQANNNLNVAIEGIVRSQYELDKYLKGWNFVNGVFRAGVTTASPLFMVSNAIRDIQEAIYYTSDTKGFLKAYPEAVKQIRENGELYQQFMASGITAVSNIASDGSIKANLKQKLGFIKRANDVVEMLPRFTEYIRTINELGNTYEGRLQAQYNAKEITTNFSRGGKFTKFLNRNGFNFLNASVQGGSKFIRQISETIDNGKATGGTFAEIAKLSSSVIIKGIMWGMAPQLLNELICSFFEGYDELDDSLKQQYYLIPAKDGKFIRIPKGRAMVVGAVMGNSLLRIAKGEEVNPVEEIKTIWENIGVSKPTGLWTPIVDAMNNRTWYDGTLINQSLSQKPNAEQYDESTDDISKYLGKLFNIPPKAINYVLDQWTGVLGNFLLPMITDKTKGGTLWEYAIANPVKKRFTTDSVTNNKISDVYYDEVNAVKTELKSDNAPANATLVNKYFNEQTDAVNDVWEKIHQIQNYSNLTPIEQKALDSEFKEYGDLSQYKVRTEVIRDSRKIINGIQRNALENLEAVNTVSKEYADKYLVGDYTGTDVNNAYLEMNYDLFGAEYALKNHYGDVYIKAQEANAVGIDYDSYYQYYIATKDLNAKDENGNSVTGLKKERVMEAIESLDLSAGQKAFLFAESGYKLNNSMKSQLWNYIESLSLSASEKQAIYDELTE